MARLGVPVGGRGEKSAGSWGFSQVPPKRGKDGKIDWENECGPLLPNIRGKERDNGEPG